MKTNLAPKFESSSQIDTNHALYESLPSSVMDSTQRVLRAQLLGEEAYRDLTSQPSYTPDGTEVPNAYKLEQNPDFSPEGIHRSALMLAAETLPKAAIDEYDITHDILDSVSYQYPPTYETIHLMINAWEATGHGDELFGIIGEMIDFMNNRRIRDELIEALMNAKSTGEDFRKHYDLVLSRYTADEKKEMKNSENGLSMLQHHDIHNPSYRPPIEENGDFPYDAYQERLVQDGMLRVFREHHSLDDFHDASRTVKANITGTMPSL